MSTDPTPLHSPYRNVVVGHEVEIRIVEQDSELICSCEYEGDMFGGSLDLSEFDPGSLELTVAIDNLVSTVANLVYNELLASPVFRDEDEEWVGRVSAQQPWARERRKPTLGWVADFVDPELELEPEVEQRDPAESSLAAAFGDADVSELRLSQDELASLMRGDVPDDLIERILRARSTDNLLASVASVLGESEEADADLARAARELAEVRRRFGVG